jgi:hypothetical protein
MRQHLQRFCHGIGDIREEPTLIPFEDSERSNAPKKGKGTLIKQPMLSNVAKSLLKKLKKDLALLNI